MRKIHLIRHGRTAANENWLYCGATDIPLTENGRQALAELRESRVYPDISRCLVCTSGMLRTEQTLFELFGDVPHITEPGLREMDFGDFEMRAYSELKNVPEYIEWISGDNEKKPCPNGESGEMMQARVISAFDRLVSEYGQDILIVAHGGVIAAIMSRLFPNDSKNRYDWQPSGGAGYTVFFENGSPSGYDAIPHEK